MLDPNIKKFLDVINTVPQSNVPDVSIQEKREQYLMFALHHAGWPLKMDQVQDIDIPGHAGLNIPIRIYQPKLNQKLPVLLYIHGGGWQRGDLTTHDSICRYLARYSSCHVVSVEWRLAPEHPFPAGI